MGGSQIFTPESLDPCASLSAKLATLTMEESPYISTTPSTQAIGVDGKPISRSRQRQPHCWGRLQAPGCSCTHPPAYSCTQTLSESSCMQTPPACSCMRLAEPQVQAATSSGQFLEPPSSPIAVRSSSHSSSRTRSLSVSPPLERSHRRAGRRLRALGEGSRGARARSFSAKPGRRLRCKTQAPQGDIHLSR